MQNRDLYFSRLIFLYFIKRLPDIFLFQNHFNKLLQIQARLSNYEIIKPGREFVKAGELFKLCRKEMQLRYFILVRILRSAGSIFVYIPLLHLLYKFAAE